MDTRRRMLVIYAASLGATAIVFAAASVALGARWPVSIAAWAATYALAGVALGGVIEKGGVARHAAVVAIAVQLVITVASLATTGRASVAIGVVAWIAYGVAAARCWSVRDWTGVALLPGWAWATVVLAARASAL